MSKSTYYYNVSKKDKDEKNYLTFAEYKYSTNDFNFYKIKNCEQV